MPFFPDKIAASHSCSSFTPMTCSRHFSSHGPNLQFIAIIALRLSVAVSGNSTAFQDPLLLNVFPLSFCHTLATGIPVSDQMAHMESQNLNIFASGFCFSDSAMSGAYPASGTSQFSAPPSLSSLPAFLLTGVLCFLCFATTTYLVF